MNKLILFAFLFLPSLAFTQGGYEIKVTLKPFKNQYIYLGHYSGKQFPIVDSVKLNANSQGSFKGNTKLGGGIYVVVYPSKANYFEMLVDKQQRFSVVADTLTLRNGKQFINSPDNVLFQSYQTFMTSRGTRVDSINRAMRGSIKTDSLRLSEQLVKTNAEIAAYRKTIITNNPSSLLSVLLHLMEEPKIPPATKQPGGNYDSTYAYQYFKKHYWDGINFYDDRVTRTPSALFEERLDKYYNTLVFPQPDSVIKELNWMLGYASASKEMTRFLLVKFITRYLNQKYMWEDAVFVHLFERYFSQKEYDWLTPQGKKIITDRAYSLMANIMGNPAENITLNDSTGTAKTLYNDSAKYTLVVFWDPTCGHCKEVLPKLDSMYLAKWKQAGLRMYSVAKETEGTRKDWTTFITQHQLNDWTNVYYSKQDEKKREEAGIPGYSQLYDVQTFPTIYLLDKDKRIVAKKLAWEQIDEILQLKIAGRQ